MNGSRVVEKRGEFNPRGAMGMQKHDRGVESDQRDLLVRIGYL